MPDKMAGDINREEMKSIARVLMWWQTPELTLANPRRFLCQLMTLGTWPEVQKARQAYGLEAFKDALVHATPGVFDAPSWSYWRLITGLPEADLPVRSLQ